MFCQLNENIHLIPHHVMYGELMYGELVQIFDFRFLTDIHIFGSEESKKH